METAFWISVGAIFVLLILSAFFSGSETAMTAASRARMHAMEKDGNTRAGIVNRLRLSKDRLIGALLLGNNLVNILASAIATAVLIKIFGETGVAYATLGMTLLVLIFAEVLPKSYAIHNADKVALAIAPIVNAIVIVLAPITAFITGIVRNIMRLFKVDFTIVGTDADKEELLGAIELHQGLEEEIREERAMLRSILDLAEVDVSEVMTHRSKAFMLDAALPTEQLVQQVLSSTYTRLPLWKETPENIIGVIHVKALLKAIWDNDDADKLDVISLAAEPWFIPDTTTLFDQLQEFRARREHIAIVVDEYGSFKGIITLEDILEEIVGEIDDEYDASMAGVKAQPNGSYLIEGTVTIRDLNREYEWGLPDEDYSTIAGLILHESKTIPEVGQTFLFYGYRFDVLRRKKNQITLIRVTPINENDSKAA